MFIKGHSGSNSFWWKPAENCNCLMACDRPQGADPERANSRRGHWRENGYHSAYSFAGGRRDEYYFGVRRRIGDIGLLRQNIHYEQRAHSKTSKNRRDERT